MPLATYMLGKKLVQLEKKVEAKKQFFAPFQTKQAWHFFIMVPTQKFFSNSRTFQDIPGHFQLIFQDNHHKN